MTIRLFWQGGERQEVNFGDSISPLIVEMMAKKPVCYAEIARCDIAAIGSILDKVIKKKWKRPFSLRFAPLHIWGSGSFAPDHLHDTKGLRLHAVRGPKTRDTLHLATSLPLGDPGLLIRHLVPAAPKKFKYGIIPHVLDQNNAALKQMANDLPQSCWIDLADPDLKETARRISACERIISTSLHGIITADSYGIPNVWLSVSDKVFGADWKFADYYESVGRDSAGPASAQDDLATLLDQASCADDRLIQERIDDLNKAFQAINL